MRILVACEYSGVVRDAFINKGYDAWSCDLLPALPSPNSSNHFHCDVHRVLKECSWDLIIAHPPCTVLTVAGNRHYADKEDLIEKVIDFATMFFDYAEKVCVENPVGRLSSRFRKPNQYIEPYYFGDPVRKKTGLWLKNLPLLEPTKIVTPEPDVVFPSGKKMSRWYYETSCLPHKERANVRSKTFQGIADAMAEQWG